MFERFTDRARRIVVFSQEEARSLGHNYIGTEHILLGLLREGDGVAGKVLTSLGISLDAARQEVVAMVGRGEREEHAAEHIPFTSRAKKVLELSLRESLQLGHNYIGSEHILLGILREGTDVAAQVLVKLGADLNLARQQVVQLARAQPESGTSETGVRFEPPWAMRLSARTGEVADRLRAIESRLTSVESQVAAIARHFGIEPPPAGEAPPAGETPAAGQTPAGEAPDAAEPSDTGEPPGS